MGFDAVSTIEKKKCGTSDIEQLRFAISQKRIFITFNVKDFVKLYNLFFEKNIDHYGIIVSSQLNIKNLLKRIVKLLNTKSSSEIYNFIEFLNNWK